MSLPYTRAANSNDVYAMEEILRDAFAASYANFMPEPYVRQWYDDNEAQHTVRTSLNRTGVAEIMGRVVGFVIYSDNTITDLWVDPQYTGKEVGRALVQWVEGEFRSIGFPTITLYCYEANTDGLEFLKQLRFRKASQFPSQNIPGGPITVYNMAKMVSRLKK